MAQAGPQYRAFISYSHSDRLVADWLHRALEAYRVPAKLVGQKTAAGPVPRRLTPIFRDRDELPASASLSAELRAALQRSQFLIVICSPAAAQSHWVNEEVRQFKLLHGAEGAGRVLALVADGDPGVAGGSHCFPPALRFNVLPDGAIGSEPAEPIAADIRPNGDGRRLAKLKLVAGLTGLPLDALAQREAQRRQKQMGWLAGAALVLSLVLAVLSLLAFRGQREAERQRAEADGLVEYMLTDLREKLEPVGRLEVLDGVGQQALAYYGRQDLAGLDAAALGRRARALHLVGEVRDLRGDSDGALEAFREAERTTAEQLARDPENPERMFDHAQSLFWVGSVALQRKEWATAEAQFKAYADLARGMIEREPKNLKWLKEEGYAANALGGLHLSRNNPREAVPQLRRYVVISDEVMRRSPGNREAKWEAGQARAWLADALLGVEQIGEAISEREAELAIYSAILMDDERHADARLSLGRANEALAELHLRAGNVDAAVSRSRIGFDNQKKLVSEDPDNMLWLEMAVGAAGQHAESLLLSGRVAEARAANDWALANARRLVETDPRSRSMRLVWMQSRMLEVALLFAERRGAEARRVAGLFQTDFAALKKPDAGAVAISNWLCVLGLLAVDRQAAGDVDAARELLREVPMLVGGRPDGKILSLQKALADSLPGMGLASLSQASAYPADRLYALASIG